MRNSFQRIMLLGCLCAIGLVGCSKIDIFFNGKSKQEALAKKVKAEKVLMKKAKRIMQRPSFDKPKLNGTANSIGLWMAKELCSTPLHRLETEYLELIKTADKGLNAKKFNDEFYKQAETVAKHNQRMNIEYSLLCQKNPAGDDFNKVLDSDVISHAYYHLRRKCSDKFPSKTMTSLTINNLFYFCK
jgi:hypothetical protein